MLVFGEKYGYFQNVMKAIKGFKILKKGTMWFVLCFGELILGGKQEGISRFGSPRERS